MSKFSERGIRLYRIKGDYPTRKAIQLHPDLLNHLKSRHPPRIKKDDPATLKIYNQYLAKDKYGLEVEFYPGAIIPTPLLRYYFLFHVITKKSKILEIGTGASAIISMLAAKCFDCDVLATEIDPEYYEWAIKTIRNNKLESKIKLLPSKGQVIKNLIPPETKFDFILSNPPYYDQILDPDTPWGGKVHELVSKGESGEQFIIQLIEEGWDYLNPGGKIAFIIPKTRQTTLMAVESFLANSDRYPFYDIIGLLAGNRTRYIFRITKPASPTL